MPAYRYCISWRYQEFENQSRSIIPSCLYTLISMSVQASLGRPWSVSTLLALLQAISLPLFPPA